MNALRARTPRGVRFEAGGSVANIVLDRPEASNAMDVPATLALREAIDQASDDQYGAVLISGEESRFCGGGDVASFRAAPDEKRPEYLAELAVLLEDEIRRLPWLGKPIVAAVHGAAAGAGFAFILNADVTLAARSTKFVFAYSGIGLTPDCGVSYLLPRAIGVPRALDMAVGGRVLRAPEAESWGLITRIAEDDAVRDEATMLAAELSGGPTYALGQASRLVRSAWDMQRDAHAADGTRAITTAISKPPAMQLITEFSSR